MTQNILSYALSNDCKIGFSSGTFPGNSYTEELPDEGIKYGTWEITKRSQNTITIKVFSPYKSTMWVNSYVNTAGWNGWKQMVVNTDLQAHWPKVLHFNIEANTYKTIKEQGSNRFSQLLFLQTANTKGYGLYLLSGYGNEGGTNRYYISEIASGSQFNIEVSETSFKVTNSNHSTATVALVSFMGDIPTIQ